MPSAQTIHVPHLGGTTASYQTPRPLDPNKPTLVLINSFTTDSELYRAQFANPALTDRMNLLAIELLGHGQTRTSSETFTYWDTAIMNLQVLQALGITERVFALGTSQGGWVAVRMALLAMGMGVKIAGIILLGTSMDYESERSRKLGCWDAAPGLTSLIDEWATTGSTPDFEPSTGYCDFTIDTGMGKQCPREAREFWTAQIKGNYKGDEGRKRILMAAINLRDRDGLHGRLGLVKCPVLWMHGTADVVYSVANAEQEIKMFTNSEKAELRIVEGGQHFLSFSNPTEVDEAVVEFVSRYDGKMGSLL